MAEEESAGAPREGSILGAAGILGVNSLQRAIDTFDFTVSKLQGIIGHLGQAEYAFRGGQAATGSGSWNRMSNWMGTNGGQQAQQPPAGNGGSGGRSNGGQPPPSAPAPASAPAGNGGNPKFTPAAAPSHRAEGPAQVTGGSGGGSHRGSPRPITSMAKVAGTAGAISGVYQNLTQSRSQSDADSVMYNTVSSYYSMSGNPGRIAANTRRMFNFNSFANSGQDAAAGQAEIMSTAGGAVGSAAYTGMLNSAAQISYGNPTLGLAKSAQVATGFYNPRGYVGLRTVGIKTIGADGKRQSVTQIANQVLSQIDPQETIRSENDAMALVSDPMSHLNTLMGNWVANGVIGGDQVQAIKDAVLNILKARAHGVSASRLNDLLNQRTKGSKDARSTLSKMGVANSDLQDIKDQDASKRQGTVDRSESFDKGLKQATDAVGDFTDQLRKYTSDPNNGLGKIIGDLQGLWRGISSQGTEGTVLSIGKWLSDPKSGITKATSPSAIGHAIMGAVHGIGGLVGLGGDNENRMSVLAMRGREGPTSVEHSSVPTSMGSGVGSVLAGTDNVTSGTPHSAIAAVTGDSGAGGLATPGGAGGGTKKSGHKSGGGSSGQRMILPARGPLGAYFGQRGSMWSSGRHTGQDIRCPTGTPVHAPANGTVIHAGWDGPYGNLVKINHGGGVVSYMAHNSRIVVRVGAKVRQGQLIAYSGATGNVSGPHCHFEVRVNGHSVNPMRYVTGGGRVSGAGGGADSGTAGSGGTGAANGSGTTDTGTSGGGGGGMAGATIGMSELDILSGGGGSGSGGGFGATDASFDSGTSGTTPGGGGGGTTTPGPGTKGLAGNKKIVNKEAAKYGWGSGAQWNTLVSLIMGESGFRNTAQNRSSTAYGIFQFLDSTWKGYGGHKTSDPHLQSVYGMRYIKQRYGSPIAAKRAWDSRSPHWYDKGAWELQDDEVAQVHKGEMIVPKKEADQIREILVNGNPYKAQGNQAKSSGSAGITFAANSINITVQSSGSPTSDGQAIGKAFVDTFTQDQRIRNLQTGVR